MVFFPQPKGKCPKLGSCESTFVFLLPAARARPQTLSLQIKFGADPYIGLIYGRYLHFRILKFPLILPRNTSVIGVTIPTAKKTIGAPVQKTTECRTCEHSLWLLRRLMSQENQMGGMSCQPTLIATISMIKHGRATSSSTLVQSSYKVFKYQHSQ